MEPCEALLAPGFQAGDGQGQLAAERIQGLAAQEAEDGLGLARGVAAAGWRQRCSGPACRRRFRSGYALPAPPQAGPEGFRVGNAGCYWTLGSWCFRLPLSRVQKNPWRHTAKASPRRINGRRTLENPKNWLFREFFKVAANSKPDYWIVLENVKGLRETSQGQFESLIFEQFAGLGYSSTLWTLCASDYGVPQKRYRLFFIGRRSGPIPEKPLPLQDTALTVREAIGDLPVLLIGANIDELGYRPGGASRCARERRGGMRSSTGHLVTANNALVQKRYCHIPPGGN